MIRVLIVDDHPIVVKGLKNLLNEQDEIEVTGLAYSANEALNFLEKETVDVALLDLNMTGKNGIELCKAIKKQWPDIEVIILTSHHEDAMVYPAIKAGALSYLLKSSSYDEVTTAVKAAAKKESKLHPLIAKKLMKDISGEKASFEKLTARELEVLKELAQGKSNKRIAVSLDLSEQTVKVHVQRILSKLYVKDRTQAAVHALKEGLVPLHEG